MAKYKNCNDSGWQDSLSARLLLNQSLSLKNYFTVRNLCKKFCCFTYFSKIQNLQNTRNFCESQNFSAKYAVLHRKLQYLKEKWCSSQKIILQNVSSQTWLQPSRDKKNHPGTEKPGKNFEMELSKSPKLYFVKVTAEQVTKPFSSRNYWLVPCFCIF